MMESRSILEALGCRLKGKSHEVYINVSPAKESALNRKINALESMTALQWLEKHTEQNKLISENILTNI